MAITAQPKITNSDYIIEDDRESEEPTVFKLRPLDGQQYMGVMAEGNMDGDVDVDGSDASIFKAGFGRSGFQNPCNEEPECQGNFDCDLDVDGTDASLFKSDFGRSGFKNPCPSCPTETWCTSYPE